MRKPKFFWIKERHNPQLGIYRVAMGRMSVADARSHEQAIYGSNTMLRYGSIEEYEAACDKLAASRNSLERGSLK